MEVAGRFDRIAGVYDETREPLGEEALDRAARILTDDGCRRLLEVGIGTGRIARPLIQRGFDIVGVDLSRGMLSKARQKGIESLVIGDANNLPFEDKSFDAVTIAHVLHLLQNPAETFGKLSRVARKEVVAFVRRREGGTPNPAWDEMFGMRQAFRDAAEQLGYALPPRPDWRERFKAEVEFLATFPPSESITIQDVEVVTTLGERLTYFEKRAYSYPPPSVPDDVVRKVVERVKSSVDTGKEIRYRRVEQMAIWRLP